MNEVPKEFLEMVENDIARIDQAVQSGTNAERLELFREIDGKYQSCVMNWYNSMWETTKEGTHIFYWELRGRPEEVTDNLGGRSNRLLYRAAAQAHEHPLHPDRPRRSGRR